MTIDLNSLKNDVTKLSDDKERNRLLRLIEETQETDRRASILLAEERKKQKKLRRHAILAVTIFLSGAIFCIWFVESAISNGYVAHRHKVISLATDPLGFWFHLFAPIVGSFIFSIAVVYMVKFLASSNEQRQQRGQARISRRNDAEHQ